MAELVVLAAVEVPQVLVAVRAVRVQPIKVLLEAQVRHLRRTTLVAVAVLVLLAQHPVAETVFRQALMEPLPLEVAVAVVSKLLAALVVAVTVLLGQELLARQTLVVVEAVQPIPLQLVALAVLE